MRVAEAQTAAEVRVAEFQGRADALLSVLSTQAHARVAEAVARAEAAEAALAVLEVEAAGSTCPCSRQRGQSPLKRPNPLAQGRPLGPRGGPLARVDARERAAVALRCLL